MAKLKRLLWHLRALVQVDLKDVGKGCRNRLALELPTKFLYTMVSMIQETVLNPFEIKLSVFQGPLDRLVHLIRSDKIDVYDIPVLVITEVFSEYLKGAKELNLDSAGEFLVLVSTLVHMKSQRLLPKTCSEKQQLEQADSQAEL